MVIPLGPTPERVRSQCGCSGMLVGLSARLALAQEDVYRLPDPQLKLVHIDSDGEGIIPWHSTDSAGRIFVGAGRVCSSMSPMARADLALGKCSCVFLTVPWVYDIATRGNDLYISTVSAIYLIPNGVTAATGLKPRRIIWGMPLGHVHQCIHNMDWGREGDLFFVRRPIVGLR